jgi:hypothetical protein
MTTNSSQPDNDNLEHKLNEIKNELAEIKCDNKKAEKRAWATPTALAASWFVAGATLTTTADYLSKPYLWGLGLIVIGILGVAFCWYKWSTKREDGT